MEKPIELTRDDYDKRVKCYVSEKEEVAYVDFELNSEFRSGAVRWLLARNTQFMLTFLLVADVVILFTQVFLDAHFPPCYVINSNAQCINTTSSAEIVAGVSLLCDNQPQAVVSTSAVFYVASLSILITFELELVGLFFVLGPLQFLRNLSYYFDVFIVTTSIVLEIMLHQTESSGIASALVFARIWRLIRIGHGLFATKRRQVLANMVAGEDQPKSEFWEEEDTEEEDARKQKAAADTRRVGIDEAEQGKPQI